MYDLIEINGESYAIRFGMNALRMYCQEQNVGLNQITELGNNMGLDEACCLILCGLRDGARKAKKSCDLTVDDIADALDTDIELLEKAMKLFGNSFNVQNSTKGNAKGAAKGSKKK